MKALSENISTVIAELNRETSSCGLPVYSSLDIRDSGFKIGVVDVNLFPAGFNNLTEAARTRAATHMREFFAAKLMKTAPWRITVVPEAHTNNPGYLENLSGILKILQQANCETRLMWPGPEIPKPWVLKTPSGETLTYLPSAQALEGADALLLNHDLSGGIPKAIQGLNLPTYPSTNLGWYRRRKSVHFEIAEALLKKLHHKFDFIDPWSFSMRSVTLAEVDFNSEAGLERIAGEAEKLFATLEADYRSRQISDTPPIFIKNDAGTYGMGVVSVQNAQEVREMTRNLRKKMTKGKESVPISQIILQEGIPTALTYTNPSGQRVAAESALYIVNGTPVGAILRYHEGLGERGRIENLNQPGSRFQSLPCSLMAPPPYPQNLRGMTDEENRNLYVFLSRLHTIAASLEDCPKS